MGLKIIPKIVRNDFDDAEDLEIHTESGRSVTKLFKNFFYGNHISKFFIEVIADHFSSDSY